MTKSHSVGVAICALQLSLYFQDFTYKSLSLKILPRRTHIGGPQVY
jgi:hypothetical protein